MHDKHLISRHCKPAGEEMVKYRAWTLTKLLNNVAFQPFPIERLLVTVIIVIRKPIQ
jgi:hypothetical protein